MNEIAKYVKERHSVLVVKMNRADSRQEFKDLVNVFLDSEEPDGFFIRPHTMTVRFRHGGYVRVVEVEEFDRGKLPKLRFEFIVTAKGMEITPERDRIMKSLFFLP